MNMYRSIKDVFTGKIHDTEEANPTQPKQATSTAEMSQDASLQNDNGHVSTKIFNMPQPGPLPVAEIARLQTSLAERDAEVHRQNRRNSSMYKQQKRLRRQNQRLKRDIHERDDEYKNLEAGFDHMIASFVQPYAKKRNMKFHANDLNSLNLVGAQLLRDAMETLSLRGRIQVLQDQIIDQIDAVDCSHEEVDKLSSRLEESTSERLALQMEAKAARAHAESAQEEVRSAQAQLQASRSQVQTLQNQLLAGVDKVNVYTDDQFSQDFRALATLVKSLSRSVRMAEKANVIGTLEPCGLLKDVASRHWDSRARIKSYIEAWVWSVLVDNVFSGPFRLFGDAGQRLCDDWYDIFGVGDSRPWPNPSASSEKWRYTTMEQLLKMVGRATITQGQADVATRSDESAMARCWSNKVIKSREGVAHTIGEKLLSISSTVDVSRISHIINKAFSLAHQMSLQRSRIQVTFPLPGAEFVDGELESMPDGNGNDMTEGKVAFIVNPGLTKWGDANGKKLGQCHNIILPLVQLEESRIKREVYGF